MKPKFHIVFGIVSSIIIYFLFPQITLLHLLVIFASSVLIDGDHYFYYILKKRNLNLIQCFRWYRDNLKKTLSLPMNERKKIYSGFYIFHGIEWIIIIFVLGFYINPIFYFVSFGFLIHFLVDTPSEFYFKRTFDKISLVWNYHRFRKTQI